VEQGKNLPDDQLIAQAREGSLDAFNMLVERYQDGVYSLCRRLLGDPGAAEDATQEAFISAFRAIGSFAGGNFRAWLFRIAANESKDELRRRQRRPKLYTPPERDDGPTLAEPVDESVDVAGAVEQVEFRGRLEEILLEIPYEQRQAIVLADVHGYRYEEIASIAGCSLGTVKSRISRGRERLRAIVARDPELSAHIARLGTREETTP
jgi:RNA polymerase sigma-70 factor (ECF subfamily)